MADKDIAATIGKEWAATQESQSGKLVRKTKEAPFVPIGIAGTITACLWGAYKYKNRGGMSTSVYLMQLRVLAQSMVVGAITIGVGYTLFKDYYYDHSDDNSGKRDQ